MPINCKSGQKPRYRSRDIEGGRQRIAYCGNQAIEVATYKGGKKTMRRL